MAELVVGRTLKTAKAVLPVENLPVGRHVFELRVEDDSGNLSRPDRVIVVVRGRAPRVTSFDPVFGRPKTRVVLRVSGVVSNNFAADHDVRFGGVKATVTGGSSKTLHTIVPGGATTGPVTLLTRNGAGVSADLFYVPESRFLTWPGATAPCFGPGGGLVAALDSEGIRIAAWSLKDTGLDLNRPESDAALRNRASRLLWLTAPEASGFLAWHPGSTTAHLVPPGENRSQRLRLPGAAIDIQTPVAGEGSGAAGFFKSTQGAAVATLSQNLKTWKALEVRDPRAVALSHDGKRLAIATGDGMLLRFALPDGRLVEKFPVTGGEKVERVLLGNAGGIWALSSRLSRAIHAQGDRVVSEDLGMRAESAMLSARGDQLFCAGEGRKSVLEVRAQGSDRLLRRTVKLPLPARGGHVLAFSPDTRRGAVLHHGENSISFVSGRTLVKTVTLPLGILGGSAITGGGKTPAAATSPDGLLFAFASEAGVVVLQAASVIV